MVTERIKMIAWTGLVGIIALSSPYLPVEYEVRRGQDVFLNRGCVEYQSSFFSGKWIKTNSPHRRIVENWEREYLFGFVPLPRRTLNTEVYSYSCEDAYHPVAGEYNPCIKAVRAFPNGKEENIKCETL